MITLVPIRGDGLRVPTMFAVAVDAPTVEAAVVAVRRVLERESARTRLDILAGARTDGSPLVEPGRCYLWCTRRHGSVRGAEVHTAMCDALAAVVVSELRGG